MVTKKIELDEEMMLAMLVAFDELSNSGDWTDYITEKQYTGVQSGIRKIKKYVSYKDVVTEGLKMD